MADDGGAKTPDEAKEGVFGLRLKRETLLRLVIAAGVIGIGLIFVSSLLSGKDRSASETAAGAATDDTMQTEEYRRMLSEELGNMVASIEGAGRTKLMLTLDGTVKNIYASDSDIRREGAAQSSGAVVDNEKRSCIVVRTGSGSEQALTVGQTMPAVRGVLIVCEGGGNKEVAERIRSAAAAALNISASRVCVLKMSS